MANRTIQQKIRKLKRFRRFARFSGATTKYAVRVETAIVHIDDDKVKLKELNIPVGPVHLSKQVVNTGRSPNSERMQQYYKTVEPQNFLEPLKLRTGPEMFKWLQQYVSVLKETPINNRITLAEGPEGRLDLFFAQSAKEWFFVEIDYRQVYIRRSRIYSDRKTAIDRLKNQRINWVEYLTQESLPPPAR